MSKEEQGKSVDTSQILSEIGRLNQAPRRASRASVWPLLLLFLVVLVIGAGGGWFVYQQWLAQQSYDQIFSQLREDNQQLRQQLADAQQAMDADFEAQLARLRDSEAALQQTMANVDAAEQRDEQRLNRLQQQVSRDMQDVSGVVTALQGQVANLQRRDLRWLSAEAAYLMRLAQRKLVMEADVASTLLLLSTIDELLAQQESVLATTAQQNVQQDIRALQETRLPNRVAIAEQLIALGDRLQQLSFASSQQDAYVDGVQQQWQQGRAAANGAQQSWLNAALDLLRTVFVWREVDRSQPAFLQPDQEQLLKQQMMLQLEQARLAVVQADDGMYQQALRQLGSVITRYADEGNSRADALLAEIETLSQAQLSAQLPDLSVTASLINQLASASAAAASQE
jgi:uroporphyrin-III C-methyltransferase